MTTSAPPIAPEAIVIPVKKSYGAFTRLLKYTAVRLISLFVTVVIGIFLTIVIANMGGYVDTIRKAEIREGIMLRVNGSNLLDSLSQED